MKFRIILLAVFTILNIQLTAQDFTSKIRVYANKTETIELQKLGINMENISGKPGIFLDIELNQNELNKISGKGFLYEVLIKDVSKYYQERYAESVKKHGNSLKGINYITPVNFNYGSMGGFLTLDEIYVELDDMASLYPGLISAKYIIGNTQTIEGRDVYAVRISDNPTVNEDEPEVLYTSLTHAREPAAMQALIWYMWYLLENYDTNPEIQYLINNLEMYFVPAVNPDGYEYNRVIDPDGGGMWRKNMRDNNGGGFSEYYDGVDLNRNFGYQWGYDDTGSSPDPTSQTYRGTAAFSEPETQIQRDFTNEHDFLLAHNHHTYSNLIIIPWGYEEIHTPDDDFLRTSAHLMASENGYIVGQGWEILYTVNGDANDWMYGEQTSKPKIFPYTQETGSYSDGFWPAQSRIIPLCEDSYLSNLYLARFATPYAELTDNSPLYVSKTGYLKFNLKRMGLSGDGNYTVSITNDNSVFSALGYPVSITLAESLDAESDSVSYTLSNDVLYGDDFTYTITVTTGDYSLSKEITKSYYETEVIIEDPGNNMNYWTSASWSVTEESYHSANSSITDSEGTNYTNDANNSITLTNEINLTDVENPHLFFWAKWNIENDWDYVQLFISTNNGSSWTPVETEHTNPGSDNYSQPTGQPLYDAASSWIEESLDLSSYIGQSVKFRFELHSDGSVNEDGFYFDDFSIISTLSSILNASVTAEPGCGANSGTVTVYSTMSGSQTFYLRDDSGNPISDWTGDATYYEFTGLANGTYRGQVENGSDMSPLSDAVELINVLDNPVVPSQINASETSICEGSSTTLTYTGGSGETFVWFTGSCGGTVIGDGNDLVVSPVSETTYYGRWENVCGFSDCESITIYIAESTSITSQPENVNATVGNDISFSVSAGGENLTYQWRKNSADISGATDATYSINNVQVSDAGNYDVIVSGDCGNETSETAVLTVSSSIETFEKYGITIYPNPSNGSFSINFPDNINHFRIIIKDVTGKILYNQINDNKTENNFKFYNYSKGIYFVTILFDNHLTTSKLIVN